MYDGALYLWVLTTDRTALRHFGAENFEVTARFFKNLCATALDHTKSIPGVSPTHSSLATLIFEGT